MKSKNENYDVESRIQNIENKLSMTRGVLENLRNVSKKEVGEFMNPKHNSEKLWQTDKV